MEPGREGREHAGGNERALGQLFPPQWSPAVKAGSTARRKHRL